MAMLFVDPTTRNFHITPAEAAAQSLYYLPQPLPYDERNKPVEIAQSMLHVVEAVGIRDFADGQFRPTDTSLEQGARRRRKYLLDQAGCEGSGFRLLVLGCGYGGLLRAARKRGAIAIGVSLSAKQVEHCRREGEDAFCCSYRDLLETNEWHGKFDAVIADGSLAHWVRHEDALAGKSNEVYRQSFQLAEKLLDPDSTCGRYVTATIHSTTRLQRSELQTPWHAHQHGSRERHLALLRECLGEYYPTIGQLESCAKSSFTLVEETDSTHGYRRADEYRREKFSRSWRRNPRVLARLARLLWRHPRETLNLIRCLDVERSTEWRFAGDAPPMRLLHQTWQEKR